MLVGIHVFFALLYVRYASTIEAEKVTSKRAKRTNCVKQVNFRAMELRGGFYEKIQNSFMQNNACVINNFRGVMFFGN